jgi:hypothetical protein
MHTPTATQCQKQYTCNHIVLQFWVLLSSPPATPHVNYLEQSHQNPQCQPPNTQLTRPQVNPRFIQLIAATL